MKSSKSDSLLGAIGQIMQGSGIKEALALCIKITKQAKLVEAKNTFKDVEINESSIKI